MVCVIDVIVENVPGYFSARDLGKYLAQGIPGVALESSTTSQFIVPILTHRVCAGQPTRL